MKELKAENRDGFRVQVYGIYPKPEDIIPLKNLGYV